MGTVTVRVSTATRDCIAELAAEKGASMASVVDEAVRDYRRKRFFERLNEAVERTRADPEAWADYQAEVAIFDNAAGDGLGSDDIPAYDLPEDAR
jgi:homoaconitase/3-isopropylmalate dehydratase large subunit